MINKDSIKERAQELLGEGKVYISTELQYLCPSTGKQCIVAQVLSDEQLSILLTGQDIDPEINTKGIENIAQDNKEVKDSFSPESIKYLQCLQSAHDAAVMQAKKKDGPKEKSWQRLINAINYG
jgi:hypothetical protein